MTIICAGTYSQWLEWDSCSGDVYSARACNLTRRFKPGVFRYIPPTARVVVVGVFRDPVQRFRSAFASTIGSDVPWMPCGMIRCTRGSALELRYRAANVSINELAALYPSAEFTAAHNLQAKFFGLRDAYEHTTPAWRYVRRQSTRVWRPLSQATPSSVEMETAYSLAVRRLEALTVVGVLDGTRFHATLYLIARELGVHLERFCTMRNLHKVPPQKRAGIRAQGLLSAIGLLRRRRQPASGGVDALLPSSARLVRSADHFDHRLHQHAVRIFDQRMAHSGVPRLRAECGLRPTSVPSAGSSSDRVRRVRRWGRSRSDGTICQRAQPSAGAISDVVCGQVCELLRAT